MGNTMLKQVELAGRIDSAAAVIRWNDWKWQVKNAIRDIPTFERLTGTRFDTDERDGLEKTIRHFPMSITPYYLSLIDVTDMKNDPIFRQCFP